MHGQFADSQNFIEQDNGQQVRWQAQFHIQRYPTGLASQTSVPYLFSPNFYYQFDFNYRERQVQIKETQTQFVYFYFPKDLINIVWEGLSSKTAVSLLASRFKWISEKSFRIVNKSNLDCLFEICSNDPLDQNIESRFLRLISVAKVDNMHQNSVTLDSKHLIDEAKQLSSEDVLNRLCRKSQSYKIGLVHALNTRNNNYNLRKRLNGIDYLQSMRDYQASYDIEMSYTWLDWRIIKMIETG